MTEDYLTVSQLTTYVKRKFDYDPYLERVFVKGEISNYNPHRRNAHQYFSIKDKGAKLSVVLFQREAKKLSVELEDGMSVLAVGRLSVFEKNGTYQLYADHIEPEGLGQLYAAYEKTKKKLTEEGWFNQDRKQPLVRFPRRIAVVTSPSGAVIRDIETTVARRFPIAKLTVFPTLVQGDKAAESIVKSIKKADKEGLYDTIIVARGGGSFEDLFPFNEEQVALAIAQSKTPVISSVGHETDTTLADLAADVRAATPTAAAEIAVPVLTEELGKIDLAKQRLFQAMHTLLKRERERINQLSNSYIFRQPSRLYDGYSQNLDQLTEQLIRVTEGNVQHHKQATLLMTQQLQAFHPNTLIKQAKIDTERLEKQLLTVSTNAVKQEAKRLDYLIQSLDYLSPLNVLGRGYAITRKDDAVISSVKDVRKNDEIDIRLADGSIAAKVMDTTASELKNHTSEGLQNGKRTDI